MKKTCEKITFEEAMKNQWKIRFSIQIFFMLDNRIFLSICFYLLGDLIFTAKNVTKCYEPRVYKNQVLAVLDDH